jgi:hypothetical protein
LSCASAPPATRSTASRRRGTAPPRAAKGPRSASSACRICRPLSIYELAKRLERDYKNVHTDVTRLAELGLIERRADGGVVVPWEAVRAELQL